MRILLIEDEVDMVILWKEYLASLNAEISVARNYAEAEIEMRKIPPPDMVFLDLVLPDSRNPEETLQRGVEMLRRINPETVVIVITGVNSAKIAQLAITIGADGFRNKSDVMGQQKLWDAARSILKNRQRSPRRMTESCLALIERLDSLLGSDTLHA